MTRMGNAAVVRKAFQDAKDYVIRWDEYEKAKGSAHPLERPNHDPKLETLAAIMRGEIRVNIHCYRKDDLLTVLRIADEFGWKARRIPPRARGLQDRRRARQAGYRRVHVGRLVGLQDGSLGWNPGERRHFGLERRASFHTLGQLRRVQRLWHEASKAVRHGMTEEQGLKALTLWPASIMGLESRMEASKRARTPTSRSSRGIRSTSTRSWI